MLALGAHRGPGWSDPVQVEHGVGLPLRGRRRGISGIVAIAAIGAVFATAGTGPVGAVGAPASDFDGDGYGDLVLGVAGEDVSGDIDAGTVTVVYGDKSGVNLKRSQAISQAGPVVGESEPGDQFGRSFATGDLNGDGLADLVVGAPNEAIGPIVAAGNITVIYGASSGLNTGTTQEFSQAGNVAGDVETGDRFGSSLTIGDFNGDGFGDVVVGVPGEDAGDVVDAGSINVLYGSSAGLRASGNASFSQGAGVAGSPQREDRFASSLAVGDFDGDGYDDVAVGVPGEDVSTKTNAGAVTILYGSSSGIGASRSQNFSQAGSVKGSPESSDAFGSALAAGDFNGDGRDDLAVGVPGEDVGSKVDAGSVNVLYGSSSGLRSSGNKSFSQAGKVNGKLERDDRFGTSLAAGDFNNDGRDDLAIGVPGEDIGSKVDAGQVNVLYGGAKGLKKAGDFSFSQAGKYAGRAEPHDLLGSSVVAIDLDGDGYDDLVAGAPGEDIKSAADAGVANVVYGTKKGLRRKSNETVGQRGAVAGSAEAGDGLGLPTYESWLDRINLYRRQAGLDPVSENARLSAASVKHSKYMVDNAQVTHAETPGNPSYSAAGNEAGNASNVYGTTLVTTSDITAVDGWVTGPFHAVGFLTPNLVEVGYGAYRDAGGSYIQMGATLNIWGAQRDWSKTVDSAYAWPGNGSVVPVGRHVNEWPSPTTECPGSSGLPVLAFFQQPVDVGAVSFTLNGAPLTKCVFDGTNYSNPDSSSQSLGRQILKSANAVVVMPKAPLTPGETYCFSVNSRNESVSSCFTVDPNAQS